MIIDEAELVLVGKAEELLERLSHLRDLWESNGRPKAEDFEAEFVPKERFQPGPDSLSVERKYHWQVLHIPE